MADLDRRYAAALYDKEDQYEQDLSGIITSETSWKGHIEQYESEQHRLGLVAAMADFFHCQYDHLGVVIRLLRQYPDQPIPGWMTK